MLLNNTLAILLLPANGKHSGQTDHYFSHLWDRLKYSPARLLVCVLCVIIVVIIVARIRRDGLGKFLALLAAIGAFYLGWILYNTFTANKVARTQSLIATNPRTATFAKLFDGTNLIVVAIVVALTAALIWRTGKIVLSLFVGVLTLFAAFMFVDLFWVLSK